MQNIIADQYKEKLVEWIHIFLQQIQSSTLETHVKEEEGYKFKSVQHFDSNFDIDALDIAANLELAIPNNNLVVGAMYFPRKMLIIFAQMFPEETRSALRNLFDESKDVGERINQTQKTFLKLQDQRNKKVDKPSVNTFIGLRFISLLLGYRYPDKYNPLKPAEWKVFCRFLNPSFKMPFHTSPGEQYEIYSEYIELIRGYIKTRDDILKIKEMLVEGLEFRDTEHRWITQDVIYVTAQLYATKKSDEVDEFKNKHVPARDETEPIEDITDAYGYDETGFMPYEEHLEEYVMKNWASIDFGEELDIYYEEDGTTGQQYTTDVGIIDILARDKNKDFVVMELKRAESGYKVVGQILNYMSWVQNNLAQYEQKVRGMIIVGKADKTLLSAIKQVSDKVELKEYSVKMTLNKVAEK